MTITANSYFSGAGLFDIGLMRGGLSIQQCEQKWRRIIEGASGMKIEEVLKATARHDAKKTGMSFNVSELNEA